MTEKIYEGPRGNVHYWVSRCGAAGAETLVLLHGLTADHRLFEAQWTAFLRDYDLIAWDAPAHGCSRPYREFT